MAKKKTITNDKYALYEASVQDVVSDADIIREVYKKIYPLKTPHILREDFCGTFSLCCEWVKKGTQYKSIGIDLSSETIEYGKKNHLSKLSKDEQKRVSIYQKNVKSKTKKADIIVANNFSYFIFLTRKELCAYFKHCLSSLTDDGLLQMDIFGGPEAEEVLEEKTTITDNKIKTFKYIWELADFNPITRKGNFYIHFQFPKAKRISKAFHYYWRMWTIPEIRELLYEAGFTETYIFWEEDDEDGDGTGEFYLTEKEENDPTWLAYIVAGKKKKRKA